MLYCFAVHISYAQCPGSPPGNQTSYGQDQWIGYVYTDNALYSTPPATVATGTYRGYITNTANFDTDYAAGSISGTNLCGTYNDNFGIKYKMQKTFAPGYYTFNIGGDDGYRLSIDGGSTYLTSLSDWALHSHSTRTATMYLSGTLNLVIEFFERTGQARLLFNYAAAPCESTAPTSITGTTTLSCGASTTLTATGGTAGGGSTYQWGTGTTVGQNVISGQTGVSITVTPTTNTTYWVRRQMATPCSGYTDGVTVQVTVPSVPGDPTQFGDNAWNAYAYSGSSIALTNTGYIGYYTQATLGFDTTTGTNSWSLNSSPSSSAGWQGCTVPADNFTLVYKRKGFPCGRYTLVMQRWDDEAIMYINGVQVWYKAAWSGTNPVNEIVGTFDLDANSTVEFRVREITGGCFGTLAITETGLSTAPTAITGGNATICSATSKTLTATGGTLGANAVYQWGTGTVGSNIISGQSGASITVAPTSTTTYWVRIHNTFCNTYTAEATTTLTVTSAGTLSSTSVNTCYNNVSSNVTLTGNPGAVVKWQTADNAAFTQGVTDISNTTTTLTGTEIGILTANKYVRAVVQSSCGQLTTPVHQITVAAPVMYNGSWSSTPDSNSAIIVESNLTLSADLNVCSCEVKNSAVLTVQPGTNFTVKGKIKVAPTAALVVHNTASLLQTENIANEGNVEIRRNSSKIKRLDYTLWSSPVQGQQLLSFSPLTLTNRFYEYNTNTNQYTSVSPNGNFETGKGYLIRTPNNHPNVATVQEGKFTGVPNNGDITRPLTYTSAAFSYNAIGNPYPSPIRVADFIDANLSTIEGTLWFWRKTNDSNENRSYSTVTKFGYTANGAAGGENDFAIDPNGLINTGQGFIIKAKSAGQAVFNNSMRTGNSSNQFFRFANSDLNPSRIWLNVNTAGAFSQTMFGYVDDATYSYDNGYDGLAIIDGNLNIYTYIGDTKLAIQARPDFTVTDVVPLGFKTLTPGTFTFSIDHVEGLFTGNQAIFIKDNLLNLTHNIKESGYTFTSEAGTFENRFEVVYVPLEVMGYDDNDGSATAVIYSQDKSITVESASEIKSVTIYDLWGRIIFEKDNIEDSKFTTTVHASGQQVLIAKITLTNGGETTKKIFLE